MRCCCAIDAEEEEEEGVNRSEQNGRDQERVQRTARNNGAAVICAHFAAKTFKGFLSLPIKFEIGTMYPHPV